MTAEQAEPTRRTADLETSTDAAFSRLYRDHHDHVLAYCLRRTTRASAEDATAEVFTIVWRKFSEMPQAPRRARGCTESPIGRSRISGEVRAVSATWSLASAACEKRHRRLPRRRSFVSCDIRATSELGFVGDDGQPANEYTAKLTFTVEDGLITNYEHHAGTGNWFDYGQIKAYEEWLAAEEPGGSR